MMRRRWLSTEVIQSSATDCGPASLKSLLEGFGICITYARLREACQTDIDGSSISTIGDVAVQLGLDAEEIMLPSDHLLIDDARALPALVVARLPNGFTHFLVLWRRHGNLLQVMDPAIGRRWIPQQRLLRELHVHQTTVPAAAWREWAGSENFTVALHRRIQSLGADARALIERANADPTWQTFALLDAAVRVTAALNRNAGIEKGAKTREWIDQIVALGIDGADEVIPPAYWSVRRCEREEGGEEQLRMRGIVLLRIAGRRTQVDTAGPLFTETLAAVREKQSNPWKELYRLADRRDRAMMAIVAVALMASAATVIVEALLFRAIVDLSHDLAIVEQRAVAVMALIIFAGLLLLLDIPLAAGALSIGRRLECRVRLALFEKLPRLSDRYFSSRLVSDMVERSHGTHVLRNLMLLASRVVRAAATLVITAAAMCWLDPHVALSTIVTAICVVAIPLAAAPILNEREMRLRTHSGALSRFSLDALLGMVAIRAHSAERAVRRQHETLLAEWMRAGLSLHGAISVIESVQTFAIFALLGWIIVSHLTPAGASGINLLLVFWALSLPVLGQEIALVLRQAPTYRNVALRILEPLSAPEDNVPAEEQSAVANGELPAIEIRFERVRVRIAGRDVLHHIDFHIPAGRHVAIVGASGAGKSTLAGVLLGFHPPASGSVFIDGLPLDAQQIDRVRRATAWVDPAVHVWNRSLLENIRYGGGSGAIGETIKTADLAELLVALPDGLQTELGEAGALVSGGEGQRVRLARALFRSDVRLVVLDEPFRGLDRSRRHQLLNRSRAAWRNATLLCITHDVAETTLFDNVIVMDGGRIVEQGEPRALAARSDSRYLSLLRAEAKLRSETWSGDRWRQFEVRCGALIEEKSAPHRESVDVTA